MLLAVWLERSQRNQEDLQILRRLQRSDERALAALYDRYGAVLYSLAFRIIPKSEDAESVVRDVFQHVRTNANAYAGERGTVFSWVVTLCRDRAVERLRAKRQKQGSKETDTLQATPLPLDQGKTAAAGPVPLKDYQDIVDAARKRISSLEAKILDLSYFGGFSQAEIARMLKIPVGTVKAKTRQGMMKLRQSVRQVPSGQAPKGREGQRR